MSVYEIVSLRSHFQPGMTWLWSVGMLHLANDMSLTGHMLKKLEVK